jgi:hypothetical protein
MTEERDQDPRGKEMDPRRLRYRRLLQLTYAQTRKLSQPLMNQLDACKDDAARRLLLKALFVREKNR